MVCHACSLVVCCMRGAYAAALAGCSTSSFPFSNSALCFTSLHAGSWAFPLLRSWLAVNAKTQKRPLLPVLPISQDQDLECSGSGLRSA